MWCACGGDGGGGTRDVSIRATLIVMVKMLFLSFGVMMADGMQPIIRE